mmetsp:Transcript_7004/g.17940  ORF Transcript_7004/g.17940 Transcript_7004/m.17940 type:complete len:267 (+) Transcript_7004:120-920(+)
MAATVPVATSHRTLSSVVSDRSSLNSTWYWCPVNSELVSGERPARASFHLCSLCSLLSLHKNSGRLRLVLLRFGGPRALCHKVGLRRRQHTDVGQCARRVAFCPRGLELFIVVQPEVDDCDDHHNEEDVWLVRQVEGAWLAPLVLVPPAAEELDKALRLAERTLDDRADRKFGAKLLGRLHQLARGGEPCPLRRGVQRHCVIFLSALDTDDNIDTCIATVPSFDVDNLGNFHHHALRRLPLVCELEVVVQLHHGEDKPESKSDECD